ncbi:MAG: glycine/betaine ABC transporter substrate-binding protein [Alicyclobacillus sp.]|nr:glycine/betaine ABC transporter substrate-binding protein [Alicyclobacillus sp.]
MTLVKSTRSYVLAASTVFGFAAVTACGFTQSSVTQALPGAARTKATVVVGSKNFSEQIIIGEMTIDLLQAAGYPVKSELNLGSTTIVRKALQSGQINLYWEYTGTALADFFHVKRTITNPVQAYQLAKKYDAKNNLVWLQPAPLNDTFTIMMRAKQAEQLGIHTIGQLASYVQSHPSEFKFGTDEEFAVRPDGLSGLQQAYHFKFPGSNVVVMDSGLVYQALRDNKVQVAMGFSTNGAIKAFGLVNLTDDKHFFPVYNVCPVVSRSILNSDPGIRPILTKLASKLTTNAMINLSYQVDIQHQDPQTVARRWLIQEGLLKN